MDTATHQILGTHMIPDKNNDNEIMIKHLEVVYEDTTYNVLIILHDNELYSFETQQDDPFIWENLSFCEIKRDTPPGYKLIETIKIHFDFFDNLGRFLCGNTVWLLPIRLIKVGSLNCVQNYINTLDYLFDKDNHEYVLK